MERLQRQVRELEEQQETYDKLLQDLEELPHKISHDVMVPIGQVAFMPGKILRTNEVMVYLGSNLFAWRSARQAIEVVERRKATTAESIEKGKVLLGEREDQARSLGKSLREAVQEQKAEGVREIREEYSEELHGPLDRDGALKASAKREPCEIESFDEEDDNIESIMKRLEELDKLEELSSKNDQHEETGKAKVQEEVHQVNQQVPFTGSVMERVPENTATPLDSQGAPPKRISKFKQAMLAKKQQQ